MSSDAELRERLTVANERLADALLMFESEDARLSHLADVINELAGALRAIDSLGAKLDPSIRLPTSEPLPHELDRDGPRTPVLASTVSAMTDLAVVDKRRETSRPSRPVFFLGIGVSSSDVICMTPFRSRLRSRPLPVAR